MEFLDKESLFLNQGLFNSKELEDFQKKYNLIDPFTDIKNIESRKYETQNAIKVFKKTLQN